MAKMDTQTTVFTFLTVLFTVHFVFAQQSAIENLGVPFVLSYDKEEYDAGIQNWDISQDELGNIYVANNDGMLVYNGSSWSTYYLPNRTLARSLIVDSDNRIYVGGQNEFGYFEMNTKGGYTFTSQSEMFEESYRDFEDVWDLQAIGNILCFRSSSRLYMLNDGQAEVFTDRKVKYLSSSKNQLYAQTNDGDLLKYLNGKWQEQNISGIQELDIKGIVDLGNESLFLLSQSNGAYIYKGGKLRSWESPANSLLKKGTGQEIAKITDDIFAIGTATAGVILINPNGSLVTNIGIDEGLISNKAQALFVDKNLNLWVGMNKGISLIFTNSPFTRITPDKEQGGIGYGALLSNNNLYLATDNGVYYKQVEETKFRKVKNSDGQTWGLDLVNDRILLSHNRGGFEIDKNEAKHIYNTNGLWSFQEDESIGNEWLIGGYEGIFTRANSEFFQHNMDDIGGLKESSRFLVQENKDVLWMAHPYRGIFKIDRVTNKIELLGAKDGLPSDLHNHVFRIGKQILFCAETGIYVFNKVENRFVRNTEFDEYFETNEKIRRLYAAPNGNIWFITSKDVGFLKIDDVGLKRKVEKVIFPFLKSQMNDGFENIYIYDKDNVFISTIKGFIHYNAKRSLSNKQSQRLVLNTLIKGEEGKNEQNQFLTSDDRGEVDIDIPPNTRSVKFDFNVINFNLDREYVYRWKLDGFGNNWSDWTSGQSKEYTNLGNGNFVFHLEAKRANGPNLSISQPFKIITPWYTSTLAKLIYGCIIGLGFYLIFIRNRQQYSALKQQVDQTVKNSKEEIKRLENERIKSELEHKKRELISTTMNLVKKNETFLELKTNLLEIQSIANNDLVQSKVKSTLKLINQEEVNGENWEQFMFHFNELNGDFVDRLQSQFEKLTPKDIKMCTYLRMNLSTKEISQLLNVTVRAVEASRYRLRKKMHLGTQANLNEYFMRY